MTRDAGAAPKRIATVMPRTAAAPPEYPVALPPGSVVELSSQVRAFDGGRVLVGGAPPRLVRLTERARRLLRGGRIRLDAGGGQAAARLATRLVALGMAHPVARELPPVDAALVTVVVPVRDRVPQVERLLGALGGHLPVIVVDDASHEPERRALARLATWHGARVLRLDTNVGPAGARNAGLRQVRTPYVAFVDSDVVVTPDALDTLLRHFHDDGLAAVAPRVLGLTDTGSGPRADWITRYEAARSSLDLGPRPALVRPGSRVSWVPSACLVARAEAIRPGFDPALRVGEDVDLVWRLAATGHRVRYEPEVTVHHDHRTRLVDWLGRKAYYGTGAHQLQLRHGTAIAPAALTPWAAGVAAALLAQRRWSVPIAAAVLASVTRGYAREQTASTAHPYRTALSLAGLGLAGTAEQTAALMLRHWWPVTAAACLVSRRARRATVAVALADTVVEYRRLAPGLDPLRFTVARRLDDLAYGAGVWAGALRGRSTRCLLPRIQRRGAGKPRG
ncbi:mycofactocin biosynthesis glycosyltransferase MftF [Streptomyces sp. NPDC059893]|uniref:mycofactocin biosynthesis glycosyltransferase MftF n=1 Tax=Streptomyces sp. NPDC059893 TaxID=3346990 RepID=UPI0036682F8D